MRSSTFQRGRIHGKAQSDCRRVVIPRPFAILMPLDYYMIVLLGFAYIMHMSHFA